MNNFDSINKELIWLNEFIEKRVHSYFNEKPLIDLPSPPSHDESYYKSFISKHDFTFEERVVVAICLAAQFSPDILDVFLTKNQLYNSAFSEFGGINDNNNGFTPSIQTALFLLSGNERNSYLEAYELFETSSKLFDSNILDINKINQKINLIHNELILTKVALNEILYNENKENQYSFDFPAKQLTTQYEWDDLILPSYTMEHLSELDMWLKHKDVLLQKWGMNKKIQKGYKALFYGSSGTGKTLTASLLGKKFNKSVYRVDLSQIISKYVGDTQKNLEKIFSTAAKKDWILFFDEADSLFGKRTQVNSSNDRHSNQETAYLLQRVEECENLVILATNLKDNFDEAFLRRFQSIIYFPIPDEDERLKLWTNGFSKEADLSKVDLKKIAKKFELSGANIMNIITSASLCAIEKDTSLILEEDILTGIRREKYKEGKII